mgnify:CR=1 FL=1
MSQHSSGFLAKGTHPSSKDSLERVVNDGDAAPGGNGVFDEITFADINDSNEIVFIAQLVGTVGGLADDVGFF